MLEEGAGEIKRARKPKARKYYRMSQDNRTGGAPPFEIENYNKLITPGLVVFAPPPGRRGFHDLPEPPQLLLKRAHRPIRDLEGYGHYWLISDQTKRLFEAFDPGGFAFVKCEARFTDGEPGPDHWLCDVIRVLDAVNEQASRITIRYGTEGKKYGYGSGGTSYIFNEDTVGKSHIFRMTYFDVIVICDEDLKDACKAAGLKKIRFRDAADL